MNIRNIEEDKVYFDVSTNRFAQYRGYDNGDDTVMFSQNPYCNDAKTSRQVHKFTKSHLIHIVDLDGSESEMDKNGFVQVKELITFSKRKLLLEKYQAPVDTFLRPPKGDNLLDEFADMEPMEMAHDEA